MYRGRWAGIENAGLACVKAELAYYRRPAFAKTPSAHVATSMTQLVDGLAALQQGPFFTLDKARYV